MKTLFNSELIWEFSKTKISLKDNNELIVELQQEKASRSSFVLNGESYIIHNVGFWKPKTTIESNGKTILSLSRSFLGSKGTIQFENGLKYECKVRNSPLVKLSFFTTEGQEILSYKLDASLKPRTTMQILPSSINERELLLLIILGCFAFEGITRENTEADFIVMVAGA